MVTHLDVATPASEKRWRSFSVYFILSARSANIPLKNLKEGGGAPTSNS